MVVVVVMVVVVHPSSLSLSLRCTTRGVRSTWGVKREKEKSRAKKEEEEEERRRCTGGERGYREGWRDKGEEIIREEGGE